MGSGVLGLANNVQVLVSSTVVGVELDCFLKFGLGAVKATHLKGQLAVLDSDSGRELVGLVLTDVAERFVGGNAADQVGQALIVLSLEVLGLDMVGVDLEQTLDLKVGLFVVARLGRCIGQRQATGCKTLDRDAALLFDVGSQFLGQIPGILVSFGRRSLIALLGSSSGSLQRLAQDNGFFFAPYGDLTGFLRHSAGGDGIERGNECDETQDLRDFRHGVLHGLD